MGDALPGRIAVRRSCAAATGLHGSGGVGMADAGRRRWRRSGAGDGWRTRGAAPTRVRAVRAVTHGAERETQSL